jgi:NADPH-dependent ferric siderophore reductase
MSDPRPAPDTAALLARLGDASLWPLEVAANVALSPSMRRLTVTAPGLADLDYQSGQDLMLAVPVPDGSTFRRRYTIRAHRPEDGTLDLDVVLHGGGPGAAWAGAARPGDQVEAIGPRGKVTVDQGAAWHLFVGDDSALPASLAMAGSLATPELSLVVLEVDPGNRQEAVARDGRPVPVRWLDRAGADPASGTALVAAVGALELPAGPGHAYLAGELAVVADLRRLLVERGLEPGQISAKPYWRAGVANAAHGEPDRP